MTDKQINTCEFFDICEAACGGTLEDIEMCHCYELYKHIARKEQECDELKKQWDFSVTHKMILEKDYKAELDQLKAENEKLDTENKRLVAELANPVFDSFEELDKLKQTLSEIKEMCNSEVCDYIQCSLNYNHSEDFECEKTSCGRAHRRKFILEILQKISECEAEDAR